jgi:hypothetical protein
MELSPLIAIGALLQEQPGGAIIVKLVPPKSELSTLSDVLLGSLGLSGVLALAGVLLGLAVAGVLFWARRRSESSEFRIRN